jgi:hypothetical protein
MFAFLALLAVTGEAPDCVYTGEAVAVDFQGNVLPDYGYILKGLRYPLKKSGWFKFVETKSFAHGDYTQEFEFSVRKGVYKNAKGDAISVCFDDGRCSGEFNNSFFVGSFTGEYTPRQMKIVTRGKFLQSTDQRDIVFMEIFESDRDCTW